MNTVKDYIGKNVLVLGLGKSGLAAAVLLQKLGAQVVANDGTAGEIPEELKALDIPVIRGSHPLELLDNCDLVLKSPGIRYDNVLIAKALDLKIPVITDVELAYEVSEADIIAITGTAGKTTTTTLIAEILTADDQKVKLAGNIGIPASEVAAEVTADETIVMELSSFQLMGIRDFHAKIAVICNIYSAHLDYHGSQEAYEAVKWRIQENLTADDFLVLNFNQEKLEKQAALTKATVVPFATDRVVDGAYSLDGNIFFKGEKIMPQSDLSLLGEHNLENALAAVAVAKLQGVGNEAIVKVLTSFAGVKHRLQYLGELDGRQIYNDSKATNVIETQKALSGFDNAKLWLLCGGLDRGNGFDEMAADLAGLKGMIVMGETSDKMALLAQTLKIPVVRVDKISGGLEKAFELSDLGDTILFSPAAASWDQYKSFEERGDLFIATFEKLRGQIL